VAQKEGAKNRLSAWVVAAQVAAEAVGGDSVEVVRLVVMLGAVLKAESVGVAAAVAPRRWVWVAAAVIVRVE